MKRVVNLTPHDVRVMDDDGRLLARYPTSGAFARADLRTRVVDQLDGVDVVESFAECIHMTDGGPLPAPEPETVYIVSRLVLDLARRDDLLAPDTGVSSAIRGERGTIIGVRRFIRKPATHATL